MTKVDFACLVSCVDSQTVERRIIRREDECTARRRSSVVIPQWNRFLIEVESWRSRKNHLRWWQCTELWEGVSLSSFSLKHKDGILSPNTVRWWCMVWHLPHIVDPSARRVGFFVVFVVDDARIHRKEEEKGVENRIPFCSTYTKSSLVFFSSSMSMKTREKACLTAQNTLTT